MGQKYSTLYWGTRIDQLWNKHIELLLEKRVLRKYKKKNISRVAKS